MNLKAILMELGNRLVTEHGYHPAGSRGIPNTGHIKAFTDWLNHTREARKILSELGVEWPVTQQQEAVEDFSAAEVKDLEELAVEARRKSLQREAEERFAKYRKRGGQIEHQG